MSKLALLGGGKTVNMDVPEAMFHWPIVNQKMKDAVVTVLEDGNMSGLDISKKLEAEFANYSDLLQGDTDTGDIKDSWNLTKRKG